MIRNQFILMLEKILCVIQCSNLGGMEKVTLESISLLKQAGYEVQMYSLHPVGELKTLAEEKDVPLNGTSKYRMNGFGNINDLISAANQFQPDRLWLVGHNFGSLLAARLYGCPAFLSIHYHHSERPLWFWRLFYGVALHNVRRIHFVSRYICEEVQNLFPNKEQTVCFPNVFPVPPDMLPKEKARAQLNIPGNAFVVGNASWLIPRKAFDVFLETARLVRKQIPEAVFVIAGDGPERRKLETLADKLGISDSVLFLGWLKELLPFYSSVDVILFNSHFDCFPTTPLEAMAQNIPVVCSLVSGGLKEALRHGQDGFLIDHHDKEALAAEIIRLYRDEEYRKKVASSGRQRVLDIGSPEKHLKYLNEFLELT